MPFGFTFVDIDSLADVRSRLVRIERAMTGLVRAQQLNTELIMSKISDFADAMNVFIDREDRAVAALQDDVKTLNDKITELQNSAGAITPEDQALLDAITVKAGAIADKLDALDDLTPPAPPVV